VRGQGVMGGHLDNKVSKVKRTRHHG